MGTCVTFEMYRTWGFVCLLQPLPLHQGTRVQGSSQQRRLHEIDEFHEINKVNKVNKVSEVE